MGIDLPSFGYPRGGHAVHVPDAPTRDVPARFWAWIAEAGITTMFVL